MAKLKAFLRDTDGFYLLLIAACSLLSVTLLLSWCNSVSPAPAPGFWEFLVKYRVALIQLLAVAAGRRCLAAAHRRTDQRPNNEKPCQNHRIGVR